jgi:ketosteroid isomerase-like protein
MNSPEDIVLGIFSAVEERDRGKFLALCHEDVEFLDASSLPYGGTVQGKAAFQERLARTPERTWLGTWDPVQPTVDERRMDPRVVATAGEEVTVLFTQRAVGADGERLESPVMGLYEVRDGMLARAQMFHYDTAAITAFLERAGAGRARRTPHA